MAKPISSWRIRHASLESLMPSPPFTLNENCRNTRAIHEVVQQFHTTPHLMSLLLAVAEHADLADRPNIQLPYLAEAL
jgi:hypothetical protein